MRARVRLRAIERVRARVVVIKSTMIFTVRVKARMRLRFSVRVKGRVRARPMAMLRLQAKWFPEDSLDRVPDIDNGDARAMRMHLGIPTMLWGR